LGGTELIQLSTSASFINNNHHQFIDITLVSDSIRDPQSPNRTNPLRGHNLSFIELAYPVGLT
jgi:hypothetical protein